MDDVKVHYNSSKPAQLNAHAYAQGNQIHLGPGQEKHLPHEAWHVVQQKQGRVKPTMMMKAKTPINDNLALEKEADLIGDKASKYDQLHVSDKKNNQPIFCDVVQGYFTKGPVLINSKAKVEQYYDKLDVGSSKLPRSQKTRIIDERWQALIDLAESKDNEGTANTKDQLISMITSYQKSQELLRAGVQSYAAASGSKGNSGKEEELPPELQQMVDEILRTKRAFPVESVKRTAKKCLGDQGHGFVAELRLGKQILEQRPDVKVQFGVVHPPDLAGFLEFTPDPSEKEVKGFLGGDLTIWVPPASREVKHTFIQSKTANANTVADNVKAAGNQLASLTASGDPVGKPAGREFTMTGQRYEGVIFVLYTGSTSETQKLRSAARSAIQQHRLFVHKVVYEMIDGFYIVTAEGESFSKTNPLTHPASESSKVKKSGGSGGENENVQSDQQQGFKKTDSSQTLIVPPRVIPFLNPFTPQTQPHPLVTKYHQEAADRHVGPNAARWRLIHRLIQRSGGNKSQLEIGLEILSTPDLLRLRDTYQEDIDLVLGYPDRVDEEIQRKVIEIIGDIIRKRTGPNVIGKLRDPDPWVK